MPIVTMPDGTAVNMPDTVDPATGARLRAMQRDSDIGEANKAAAAHEQGPVQDVIDMVKSGVTHIPAAALGLLTSLKGRDQAKDTNTAGNFQSAVHALANPQEALSSIGSTLRNATPEQVGANVVAPLLAGGAVSKVAGLVGAPAEVAANAPAAVTKYGLRTGAENPIARNVAGESAKPAVVAHNQSIADTELGAQAGVAPGTPLTAAALEKAREAPNSVYARAEKAIPNGPLSSNAAQAVQNVGADDMVVHSPDTQATIDAQKARLLSGDLSGPQVVNAQRALRFNGFKNTASADPEQSALGHAQLKMSDALHQHMLDTIPPGADVSADQLNAARTALAQNHTVDNALKGSNVDLQALARLHRDSPNLLSGPLKDFAEFADLHPEVTRLPSDAERFNPSGVTKDIASVDLKSPATYLQPFFGAAARRTLTGGARAPQGPVTGLAGEFAPLSPPAANISPLDAALPTKGISAEPLTQKLGDIMSNQRGAVGPPTDIGGLRQLMNNPRTYTGMKPEEMAALEAKLKALAEQPRTYNGASLGESF